jgi:hypothetical protein
MFQVPNLYLILTYWHKYVLLAQKKNNTAVLPILLRIWEVVGSILIPEAENR